jgi:predicted nucleotide-binding protein
MPSVAGSQSRGVFVVHGDDEKTKTKVAEALELWGFSPVILHEQANHGMTIIEKFEKHAATASFAVVLLTADDVGFVARGAKKPKRRASQNVILALGYFIGKLGRERVCVLHSPHLELPSDIMGVYTSFNTWESALEEELEACGFTVRKPWVR